MTPIRVFASFDTDHDADLYDLLLLQSLKGSSGFEISARSEASTKGSASEEKVRRRICDADEVIVVCGEHTAESPSVSAELHIAQNECKPYFLLWGRRECMCTRPAVAKTGDSMYSWTPEILQEQIRLTFQNAQPREIPEIYKRAPGMTRKG